MCPHAPHRHPTPPTNTFAACRRRNVVLRGDKQLQRRCTHAWRRRRNGHTGPASPQAKEAVRTFAWLRPGHRARCPGARQSRCAGLAWPGAWSYSTLRRLRSSCRTTPRSSLADAVWQTCSRTWMQWARSRSICHCPGQSWWWSMWLWSMWLWLWFAWWWWWCWARLSSRSWSAPRYRWRGLWGRGPSPSPWRLSARRRWRHLHACMPPSHAQHAVHAGSTVQVGDQVPEPPPPPLPRGKSCDDRHSAGGTPPQRTLRTLPRRLVIADTGGPGKPAVLGEPDARAQASMYTDLARPRRRRTARRALGGRPPSAGSRSCWPVTWSQRAFRDVAPAPCATVAAAASRVRGAMAPPSCGTQAHAAPEGRESPPAHKPRNKPRNSRRVDWRSAKPAALRWLWEVARCWHRVGCQSLDSPEWRGVEGIYSTSTES